MATKAIFGLGNPGPRYAATRHNAGFLVLAALARRHHIELARSTPEAVWGDGSIGDRAVRLVKPAAFMNRSGEAVHNCLAVGSPVDDVLVIHDELDLPFGRLKLKRGGGTAGHRGLASIQEALGDAGFARLRFGIGRPPEGVDVADFVLDPFAAGEVERLPELVEQAVSGCELWLELGIDAAMNRVNAAAPAEPPEPGGDGRGSPNG